MHTAWQLSGSSSQGGVVLHCLKQVETSHRHWLFSSKQPGVSTQLKRVRSKDLLPIRKWLVCGWALRVSGAATRIGSKKRVILFMGITPLFLKVPISPGMSWLKVSQACLPCNYFLIQYNFLFFLSRSSRESLFAADVNLWVKHILGSDVWNKPSG